MRIKHIKPKGRMTTKNLTGYVRSMAMAVVRQHAKNPRYQKMDRYLRDIGIKGGLKGTLDAIMMDMEVTDAGDTLDVIADDFQSIDGHSLGSLASLIRNGNLHVEGIDLLDVAIETALMFI